MTTAHPRRGDAGVVYENDDAIEVATPTEAVLALARRIRAVRASSAPLLVDRPGVLTPPVSDTRDHVQGPVWAPSLVVFGAYGTPASRPLGNLLDRLRDEHAGEVRVVWRHLPDPEAHPRSVELALAAEAAATESRFWSMHRELLAMRHDAPEDLHAAARLADVDFYRLVDRMSAGAGAGADRIVAHVESAVASTATHSPALFVNGERYRGDLEVAAVWAALHAATRG